MGNKYQKVKEHLHRKMASGSEQNMFIKNVQWAKKHIWEFSFLVIIQHAIKTKLTCNYFLPFLFFFLSCPLIWKASPTRKECCFGDGRKCAISQVKLFNEKFVNGQSFKNPFSLTPQVYFRTWSLWKGIEVPSKAHVQNFHVSFLPNEEWLIGNSLIVQGERKG